MTVHTTRAQDPAAVPTELRLRVADMDCASCLARIGRHLDGVDGVLAVEGSVVSRSLTVSMDAARVTGVDVRSEIARIGYHAVAEPDGGEQAAPGSLWRGPRALRIYAALALGLAAAAARAFAPGAMLVSTSAYALSLSGTCLALAALVAGWSFFPKGLAAVRTLSLDMNFLMSVAIVGALLLGEHFEAASIAVLFGVAELLETYSVDRARASIESLLEMAPERATVLRDGGEVVVAAAELVRGDMLVVRPGERVAADGTVREGVSAVDQSAITGESLPVDKGVGDEVFSGTINREGHLVVHVDRPAADSALARIVRLVEEAERSKTHSERFVERFARWYTPTVTVAAVAVAVVPPLALGAPTGTWIIRGLTLLVIACPCALVISTPVAVVSGLTAAARHGVLIKGGVFLESLGSIRVFAFDKTGTLTVGRPEVREVRAVAASEADVLRLAAEIERRSEHPLARAIVIAAQDRGLAGGVGSVSGFEAIPGKGARARIDGVPYLIGRPDLFPDAAVPADWKGGDRSIVGVAREGDLLGWIAVADRPREGAAEAIRGLRSLGIERVVVLTGDNPDAAGAVRAAVGADEAFAELLPEDKLAALGELERRHGMVAMVGDGVNDAPALAAATVGIAMGAAGSDTALETADVALMGDDLRRLPYLMRLSRRARGVIRENIGAAIVVKAILAVGVPLGYVSLITAVVAGDMGVSLAVILNALRLGRVRD